MLATILSSARERLTIGKSLGGRYTAASLLRDDGGSKLYLGRVTHQDAEPVLIKEVMPDGFASPENRANAEWRFARELEVLRDLRHPALPVVLDAFAEHGRQYLVLSYQPGETLEAMLARRGAPFAEEDVVGWALEVLSALGPMHRHAPPVIYRNIKPSSLLIDPTGTLRLLDFGLVRYLRQKQSRDTAPIGAIGYASPEQLRGSTDPRSDLFSLGVTMHHLLTGQHPSLYPPGQLPPATCVPGVSPELATIITRATELDPHKRWPAAAEMELALRRHALSLTAAPRPTVLAIAAPSPDDGEEAAAPAARLVITAVRPSSDPDEALYHLARLTWMAPAELEAALAHLPAILPLVEPYKASLRLLKSRGIEARPVWPLRGLRPLDEAMEKTLARECRVSLYDPASCEDGLCLCRHCHFGWMLDDPAAVPAACPSCGREDWGVVTLLRCHWCDHEYVDGDEATCPCCGLA